MAGASARSDRARNTWRSTTSSDGRVRSRRYDARSLNLLRELTVCQHKLRDQSTIFGLAWNLLNPLLMVGVLFAFFYARLGETVEHYGLYLLVGVVQYTYFANATNAAMRVLRVMRELTKETVFPKELLVVSSTLVHTFDFVIASGVCVIVAYGFGAAPGWALLFLPCVLVLQFMLVAWVSLLLSCAFVFARDIEHIYQVVLRMLLFVTPIFYTTSFLGDGLAAKLLALNPLGQLIALSRGILLEGLVPRPGWLLGLLILNGVLSAISFHVFKTLEPRLAERV